MKILLKTREYKFRATELFICQYFLDTIGNCEDLLTAQCQFYKDAGYCNKHPDNMKQWCEKTCFNCKLRRII